MMSLTRSTGIVEEVCSTGTVLFFSFSGDFPGWQST